MEELRCFACNSITLLKYAITLISKGPLNKSTQWLLTICTWSFKSRSAQHRKMADDRRILCTYNPKMTIFIYWINIILTSWKILQHSYIVSFELPAHKVPSKIKQTDTRKTVINRRPKYCTCCVVFLYGAPEGSTGCNDDIVVSGWQQRLWEVQGGIGTRKTSETWLSRLLFVVNGSRRSECLSSYVRVPRLLDTSSTYREFNALMSSVSG